MPTARSSSTTPQIARTAATIRNNAGGSGKLALVKNGTGTLTLTGSNCGQYTGGLTVNAGTLDYSGGTLPNCNYTIAGGTLNTGTLSKSIGTFQITGGTVSGTGTFTSNAAYDVQAGTIGVILAGSGIALNKTTSGTVILTGNNTLHRHDHHLRRHAATRHGGTTGSVGGQHRHQRRRHVGRQPRQQHHFHQQDQRHRHAGEGRHRLDDSLGRPIRFSGNLVVNAGYLNYSGNSTVPAGNYTLTGGSLNLGTHSQSIGAFQITGGTISGNWHADQQRRLRRPGGHGRRYPCRRSRHRLKQDRPGNRRPLRQ